MRKGESDSRGELMRKGERVAQEEK